MPPSHRIPILATKIAAHIRTSGLPPGTRLTERQLAEQFDMSRTPVKLALQLLADREVVQTQQGGGYVVADGAGVPVSSTTEDAADDQTYLRLAREHLSGQLPARVTENSLIRRYDLTRHQVARTLHRAAREGWAERLPGHGWRFLAVLSSPEAYDQAYRFRILIEPAGILEPGFLANRPALLACRARQQGLLNSEPARLSTPEMFDVASEFHEVLMRCSNNPFFIEGLLRLNRLRRLIEYGKSIDRNGWLARCAQHVAVIDLILADELQEASSLMRDHLQQGAFSKTRTEC